MIGKETTDEESGKWFDSCRSLYSTGRPKEGRAQGDDQCMGGGGGGGFFADWKLRIQRTEIREWMCRGHPR